MKLKSSQRIPLTGYGFREVIKEVKKRRDKERKKERKRERGRQDNNVKESQSNVDEETSRFVLVEETPGGKNFPGLPI